MNELHIQRVEALIAARVDAALAPVREWLRASQPTHDVRVTEGYMRAQNDLCAAIERTAR